MYLIVLKRKIWLSEVYDQYKLGGIVCLYPAATIPTMWYIGM